MIAFNISNHMPSRKALFISGNDRDGTSVDLKFRRKRYGLAGRGILQYQGKTVAARLQHLPGIVIRGKLCVRLQFGRWRCKRRIKGEFFDGPVSLQPFDMDQRPHFPGGVATVVHRIGDLCRLA